MIGQIVHANSRPAIWQLLMLAMTLIFVGMAGIFQNWHWAFAAVAPFFQAVVGWVRRPKSCSFTLEKDGIRLTDRSLTIPYDSITKILVNDKLPNLNNPHIKGKISVLYNGEYLVIPNDLSVDVGEFIAFLNEKTPSQPLRIPTVLEEYHREVTEKFGPHAVQVFAQAGSDMPRLANRLLKQISLALVFTCITWIVGAAALWQLGDFGVWAVLGITFLVISVLILVSSGFSSASRLSNCGIITSPIGMAVTQGDIRGAMPWGDVLRYKRMGNSGLLRIFVTASHIDIPDIYDRSTSELEMIIRHALGGR